MIQVFLELGGTFISGALMYLLLEASKYTGAEFDWKVFYSKNIKPMKWTALGSVAIIIMYSFLPGMMPFVEVQTGGDIDITSYEGLILGGGLVGGVLKNVIRKKEKAAKLN